VSFAGEAVAPLAALILEDIVKALTWHGKHDIRCESVPDPQIEEGRDAIIKVTACAICGSDLHLYNGVMPDMHSGDIMGHETMGEVGIRPIRKLGCPHRSHQGRDLHGHG
jgi:hypothetical protein